MRQPDPRNPQPGQVWEKPEIRIWGKVSPIRVRIIRRLLRESIWGEATFSDGSTLNGLDGLMNVREWHRWACPWWRRRKRWAKCVEWKEDGR